MSMKCPFCKSDAVSKYKGSIYRCMSCRKIFRESQLIKGGMI